MSLLKLALAAARKTGASKSNSVAAATQSNDLIQKVIRENIEAIPSETISGASVSVRRGDPIDREGGASILDILAVHPSNAAKRDSMMRSASGGPPPRATIEEKNRWMDEADAIDKAKIDLQSSMTNDERGMVEDQWFDLPDYARDNPLGPSGLSVEELARQNINATWFRDPVAEGLSGRGGFRSGVEGGAGGEGEGLGGTFQGSGFYVSMSNIFKNAYDTMFNTYAKNSGGKQINTKYSVDLNPESTALWDAYLVDQPELVKRQLHGIAKALFQFRNWQPSRVYPAKFVDGLPYQHSSDSLRNLSGFESPEEFDKILSDAQLANQKKYNLSEGEQVLTFEGLSRNGEDYISVDLVIPDFRPKWDSLEGGWTSGLEDAKKSVGLSNVTEKDIASGITRKDIASYADWAEKENTLTVSKWGWDLDNTLNTPVTKNRWADEVTDSMDSIDGVEDAYARMIEPDFDEYTDIPLNYDLDMTEIGGRVTKKNVNDMKTMYYSDIYRILQDTLEKTFMDEGKDVLQGRINPKFRTKEGMKAEDRMFRGNESDMNQAFMRSVAILAPEETTAIMNRFGISNHEYLSEALFLDTEHRDVQKLFEVTSDMYRATNRIEDQLYNIGSDRLNNASNEARQIISDPQMADAQKLGVIYDDKYGESIESAVIDMSHWKPRDLPEDLEERARYLTEKEEPYKNQEESQLFLKEVDDWVDPDDYSDLYDLDNDGQFLATENNYILFKEGKLPEGLTPDMFLE